MQRTIEAMQRELACAAEWLEEAVGRPGRQDPEYAAQAIARWRRLAGVTIDQEDATPDRTPGGGVAGS